MLKKIKSQLLIFGVVATLGIFSLSFIVPLGKDQTYCMRSYDHVNNKVCVIGLNGWEECRKPVSPQNYDCVGEMTFPDPIE